VTTRRLADRVEYSQPVLYSHFAGKDAIVAAVAIDGFATLAGSLRQVPDARAVGQAYLDFAREHPALYDAMFAEPTSLVFASEQTPPALHEAFAELRRVTTTEIGAEVFWSALHGLASLDRGHRLRPGLAGERLDALVRALT
jgi:AcrR family transcriptional regulator